MASDVIYFTVLFLSFSFLSPSLLPYLFMMFAVNGGGLSGPVAEILICPTTAAATASTPAQKRHHLWGRAVVWDLSSSTSSHAFFCRSCQFPVCRMLRWGPCCPVLGGCGGGFTQLLLVTTLSLCRCLSTGASFPLLSKLLSLILCSLWRFWHFKDQMFLDLTQKIDTTNCIFNFYCILCKVLISLP